MHVGQKTCTGNIFRAPALPFARYWLRFKSSGKIRLPAYTGSVWHGAFGHALKKIVCVTHLDSCPPCHGPGKRTNGLPISSSKESAR